MCAFRVEGETTRTTTEEDKTMTRTFMVTITTKKGEQMPSADRIESAVFGTGRSWDSINTVKVSEVKPKKLLRRGTKVKIVGRGLVMNGEVGIIVSAKTRYAKGLPYTVKFPCGGRGEYGINEVRKVK